MKRIIRSNWAELPGELLGEIFRRLNLIDAARAKSVCSHWSSLSLPPSDYPTTPWLLIPARDGYGYRITKGGVSHLYNPADGHLHRTETLLDQLLVSELFGSSPLLIGSFHGFLIGLTQFDHDKSSDSVVPFVSNPLTGTRIDLPRIDHLMNFEWEEDNMKAILTSAPVGRSSALVLLYKGNKLAACNCSSSSSWTELDVNRWLDDVGSAGGKIFAVGYGFVVEIWSSNLPFEKIATVKPVLCMEQPWSVVYFHFISYIVMPDLLVVMLTDAVYTTLGFEVFRMEEDGKEEWVKAESLGENRALFLDGSHSVLVPATASSGVEADCIYYAVTNWVKRKEDRPNAGVFSLRQGKIKPLSGEFGGLINEWHRQPLRWLVPTPW